MTSNTTPGSSVWPVSEPSKELDEMNDHLPWFPLPTISSQSLFLDPIPLEPLFGQPEFNGDLLFATPITDIAKLVDTSINLSQEITPNSTLVTHTQHVNTWTSSPPLSITQELDDPAANFNGVFTPLNQLTDVNLDDIFEDMPTNFIAWGPSPMFPTDPTYSDAADVASSPRLQYPKDPYTESEPTDASPNPSSPFTSPGISNTSPPATASPPQNQSPEPEPVREPRRIMAHPVPVTYRCLKCASPHPTAGALKGHYRSCRQPFQCQAPACGKHLCDKRALERHYASRHREYAKQCGFSVKKARCPICGFSKVRADNVVRHVKKVHGQNVKLGDLVYE